MYLIILSIIYFFFFYSAFCFIIDQMKLSKETDDVLIRPGWLPAESSQAMLSLMELPRSFPSV